MTYKQRLTKKCFLIAGKRTPFGKFGGDLKHLTPTDLAEHCSKDLLESSGTDAKKIDHTIFANVLPVTPDTLYSGRHLSLRLGCNENIPAYSVNRLCGSGIQAIIDACNMINMNSGDLFLVSSAENMSMSPHMMYGTRFGTKYGALQSKDMLLDALTDCHIKTPMGITAENIAKKHGITREESDQYSMRSHHKASAARSAGHLSDEITPIELKRSTLSEDQHIRNEVSIEEMAKLRSSFAKDGVVTPGSASGIVDGACSLLIASEDYIKENNITPLAEIIDFEVVGIDPTVMGLGPVPAINNLCERAQVKVEDIDLYEINEAFTPQVIGCMKELNIPEEKVNIWGGAVAVGHPLGATGTRITLTLARQMEKEGKDLGIASACIGGGQGIAILLKR